MQKCHAKVWVWKITNFQDKVPKNTFYCQVYIWNFKVLFNLFTLVIPAWNKHIHLNRLYISIVNVWWWWDVMCASKTQPLAWGDTCHVGTHMAGPTGVPSSQVSLYNYEKSDTYHIYGVWVNSNVKVFNKNRHFTHGKMLIFSLKCTPETHKLYCG